jgi:hypothetical protein
MAHSKSEIKKAKNLLNKYAPKGEQLAYINAKESKLLMKKGGAGKMTKTGIRSYQYEHDGADVSSTGGPTGNTDTGGSGDDYNYTPAPAVSTVKGKDLIEDSNRKGVYSVRDTRSLLHKAWDFVKGGGTLGYLASQSKKQKQNLMDYHGIAAGITPGGSVRGLSNNNQGNNEPRVAKNVGGKIIKLSPTTAEVSQSKAIDAAAYDNRKTKAKGRSMTILKRNVADSTLILGKKSLLGM